MKANNLSSSVLHEISPLVDKDLLYIADRHKREFNYPIHKHDVFELNFVEHAQGVRRIVGDSSEVIGDYDLVLITSTDLEHVWLQNECQSTDIHEITIQFRFLLNETSLFRKNPFTRIFRMLDLARRGLVFPMDAVMKIYNQITTLSAETDSYRSFIKFLDILDVLSRCEGTRTLATSSYAKVDVGEDSRRILKVKAYIDENYREEIKLKTLSDIACMSENAFSRFFKIHTGRTVSDYIIDIRLGNAARMLVETNKTVSDISFQCGYNNLSNFNRVFKRKKGCAPTEFREYYRKIKVIV
jgi:AraC-like DNA-binding protein